MLLCGCMPLTCNALLNVCAHVYVCVCVRYIPDEYRPKKGGGKGGKGGSQGGGSHGQQPQQPGADDDYDK